MPCYDPRGSSSDYLEGELSASRGELRLETLKRRKIEAMLCMVLTSLQSSGAFQEYLESFDYKEAGVSRDELEKWWKQHQREDELRRNKLSAAKAATRKRKAHG